VLGDNVIEDAFVRFKDLADKKKEIFEEDIIALIEGTHHKNDKIQFQSLVIQAGTKGPQIASIEMQVDGDKKYAMSEGNGPVDAIFKSIRMIVPHDTARLTLYQVHAITGGTDAQAEVTVKLEESGKTVVGQGSDTDTLVASAMAYIHALNKLMDKRQRGLPPQ
jgi:2-isopropylmalate synthase